MLYSSARSCVFFFFNDTATTEIYTLSLHDALPIYVARRLERAGAVVTRLTDVGATLVHWPRSEEHTSELQSQSNLVCRLLLEKKKGHIGQQDVQLRLVARSVARLCDCLRRHHPDRR